MNRENVVWLSAGATTFACLCETCLDAAGGTGSSFLDAVHGASVRGEIELDAEALVVRCRAGHRIVLRRSSRPPSLARADARQLQLA